MDWFPAGPVFQDIIIKGVQGLTQFQHGVVGGIHNGIDRPHARQLEPALDLVGTGFDLNVPYETHYKPWIQFGIGNLDRDELGDALAGCLVFERGFTELTAGLGAQLTRHTDHVRIACHVGEYADIQNHVAHVIGKRHSERCIAIEQNDALMIF